MYVLLFLPLPESFLLLLKLLLCSLVQRDIIIMLIYADGPTVLYTLNPPPLLRTPYPCHNWRVNVQAARPAKVHCEIEKKRKKVSNGCNTEQQVTRQEGKDWDRGRSWGRD